VDGSRNLTGRGAADHKIALDQPRDWLASRRAPQRVQRRWAPSC
jgi:hypothetical protein